MRALYATAQIHLLKSDNRKSLLLSPSIAKFINASPDGILLPRNGSDALNIVTQGLSIEKGNNVVISNLEFHNNFTPWPRLRDQKGIEMRIVEANKDLVLDPDAVEGLVNEKRGNIHSLCSELGRHNATN